MYTGRVQTVRLLPHLGSRRRAHVLLLYPPPRSNIPCAMDICGDLGRLKNTPLGEESVLFQSRRLKP